MTKRPGLWIAVDESLAESVQWSIDSKECFTTTVPSRDTRPRHAELVAVSLNSRSIHYLGVCQRGRKVVTGQTTVLVSNAVSVGPIRHESIRSALPPKFRHRFDPPTVGVRRPTPRLWDEILAAVTRSKPDAAASIRELRALVAGAELPRGRRRGGLEVFERDALASILQVWGGTALRKRELRKLTPVAPFLSSLKSAYVREDPQINHDHITFPGMQLARRDVVGSIVMSDPYGSEHLTIVNCNRQPLERTMGVDLAYYNHSYDSFVFVQYKRMIDGADGQADYRPNSDSNHADELRRMTEVDDQLRAVANLDADAPLRTYRLSDGPFYLKLCEARVKATLDAGMVSGMYFPLRLWQAMTRSSEMLGERGGVVMNWHNCRRRFQNGEFCQLLRQGWIGSAAGQSKYLSDLVEQSLRGGRMVVLGATSAGPPHDEARRDSLGRFAAMDDPDGAT